MKGSPGGLARIDALFHSHAYTVTFTNVPIPFGAFPSLHTACATIEALCLSHFFPATTKYMWAYTGVLYWATMYLSHHYLINIVGGACLATAFYLSLPDDLRGSAALTPPPNLTSSSWFRGRSKYEVYDLEDPCRGGGGAGGGGMNGAVDTADFELSETSSDDEEVDITYRLPVPGSLASFGLQQKQVCFLSA